MDAPPETTPKAEPLARNRLPFWVAITVGIAYGLMGRFVFDRGSSRFFEIVSVTFVFLVPLVMGFLTGVCDARARRPRWWSCIRLCALNSAAMLVIVMLIGWEGSICVVMMIPIFIPLAIIGGLVGFGLEKSMRNGPDVMAGVALLPFLVSPLEQQIDPGESLRDVETSITIAADPATVWGAIARVPEIGVEELPASWATRIGFPRPVAATLSHEGVGGVRHATFEGGVLFIETVTVWEPERRLAFTIHADADTIPPETLDEHVVVGGPIFDVLTGEYRIEPLASGGVRLRLTSRHRLSTHLEPYAGYWTDFVMRDIQETILAVIKDRCER